MVIQKCVSNKMPYRSVHLTIYFKDNSVVINNVKKMQSYLHIRGVPTLFPHKLYSFHFFPLKEKAF